MLDLKGYGWLLWEGVQLTVMVSVISMAGAIVVGLLAALAKLSASRTRSLVVDAYTTIVRGVPELVLLLLVYYGVPTLVQDVVAALGYELVMTINPFVAGIATITFIYGAFACEVFRGAYLHVPAGQHEAAAVLDRAAVFVGALVREARVEVREQIAHEARHFGAVEPGADRALRGFGVLLDDRVDLLLRDFARRTEVRQRLRHDRRLDAVAEVDAAVAPGVQDLLDRDAAVVVDVLRDGLELRQELVVEQLRSIVGAIAPGSCRGLDAGHRCAGRKLERSGRPRWSVRSSH